MNRLVVSCQALEDEPLHSAYIMGRMAAAAAEGGAQGIRANSVVDIHEIKAVVDLPIIGIIKKDYADSDVYITATHLEVDALVTEGVDIIALDATNQLRPNGMSLEQFFKEIKEKYPHQKWMADCSTFEEMHTAESLGFDYVSTTLFGYTKHSEQNAFEYIDKLIAETEKMKVKLVAEGRIATKEMAKEIAKLNIFDLIVIGSAITRPQLITKEFYEGINYETN